MKVCGWNKYTQLDSVSNNNSNGDSFISPDRTFHVDHSTLLSFSTNYDHTAWVTLNGRCYLIGDNDEGKISGLLPKKRLQNDTEFTLQNDRGVPLKFLSVICGDYYTLYLVTETTSSTNHLVYCYFKHKPNPLFVNIGNRQPIALFGGEEISCAVDSDGGVILIKESIFKMANKEIESSYLPDGDKVIKLACCDQCIVALGISGKVYNAEINNTHKLSFELVNELSDKFVVDISGNFNSCFVVLNDGKVFGRGSNKKCSLGMPENIRSIPIFKQIDSLNLYKIVSVFAGTSQTIFRSENDKMIVCGSNVYGELFIPPRKVVFPPEEVRNSNGFIFCITGNLTSAAFFNCDPPKFIPNKKIDEPRNVITKPKSRVPKSPIITATTPPSMTITKTKSEIDRLLQELAMKDEEILALKKENLALKTSEKKDKEKIKSLEDEVAKLKKKDKSQKNDDQDKIEVKSLQILGIDEIEELEKVKKIGKGATSEVFEVFRKEKLALKVIDLESFKVDKKISEKNSDEYSDEESDYDYDFSKLGRFVRECEVLNNLDHPNIIKTYGFCFGDSTHEPAILLEYCYSNLKKKVKRLSDKERISAIINLSSAMKKVHSVGIIHRDLKLENILLDSNNNVKLSDFGLCTFIKNDEDTISRTQMAGTLKFMAPELIQGRKDYDEKVDVYAFGVVVFMILSKGEYPEISISDVANGKQASISSNISVFSSQLIRDCWSYNSCDRPSFDEICNRLYKNEKKLI